MLTAVSVVDRYTERSVRARTFDRFHWSPPRPEASPFRTLPSPRRRYLHQHGGRLAASCALQALMRCSRQRRQSGDVNRGHTHITRKPIMYKNNALLCFVIDSSHVGPFLANLVVVHI